MASAELERSHSAMGSLSAAEKTPPGKSPSPTARATILERSASSSSSSSVGGGVNSSNSYVAGGRRQTASERLQEHRSRMHQQSRRPLTATTSVDGNTAHGALETAYRGRGCLDYISRKAHVNSCEVFQFYKGHRQITLENIDPIVQSAKGQAKYHGIP